MSERRVLLVDDELDFIEALSERLVSRGLQVVTAASGAEAIEVVRSQRPGCVILDMMMPGMCGLETLQAMLALDGNLQVIFLTGHAAVPNAIQALKLGALDYLEKPVAIEQLMAAIEQAKSRRALIKQQNAILPRNIKLSWARFERIPINEIEDEIGRSFIRELRSAPRSLTTDVYVCSDARNQAVRQILFHIPYVNVLNSAGNTVYNPSERACVVIAHGNSAQQGCGAVDYSRSRLTAGGLPVFPTIARLDPDAIENARAQLETVPEDWQAGVIFFNHETGDVALIDGDHRQRAHCLQLFAELQHCLESRYTAAELNDMAAGQNPQIILLSNISTRLSAFRLFRINLQRDRYSGIIDDSLRYAMDHSLRGDGSFTETRVAVLAFKRNEPIPAEVPDLLESRQYVREYLGRGGELYVVTVGDLPSSKTVYRISG